MNGFDYAVLFVMLCSLVLGVWRGFVREIFALLSWVVAFWVSSDFGWMGVGAAGLVFDDPGLKAIAGYALVFIGVLLLCSGVGALFRLMVTAAGLGLTDRVLGSVFGLARGLLMVLAGVLVCGLTPLPKSPWWQAAKLAPPLETAVLAAKPWLPDGLASRIRYPLR